MKRPVKIRKKKHVIGSLNEHKQATSYMIILSIESLSYLQQIIRSNSVLYSKLKHFNKHD